MQQLAPVAGYEGRYSVTPTGEVWSHPYTRSDGKRRKGIWLRPATNPSGHKQVVLTRPDKSRHSICVHRLVATAYLGYREGLQVNHKNGDKLDNSVDNLEWVTQEENLKHAHRNGLIPSRRKLTPDDVEEIRLLLLQGHTQKAIAEKFNTQQPAISKIKSGKIY